MRYILSWAQEYKSGQTMQLSMEMNSYERCDIASHLSMTEHGLIKASKYLPEIRAIRLLRLQG